MHGGPCASTGCPNDALPRRSTCTEHSRRTPDRRPPAAARGYGHAHRTRFRAGVLNRDPICTCPGCQRCTRPNPGTRCVAPSTDADHHPLTRVQLVADGADPDEPDHGRGLCHACHSSHTRVAATHMV
jgi:5-methylcytosine-specific restriction enzyme A